MKLGLNLGYAPPGTNPAELVPVRAGGGAPRLRLRVGGRGVGHRRGHGARVARRDDDDDQGRLGDHADPGRTPANTAMTAATLDLMSGGRFILGLGTSGPAGRRRLARTAVGQAARQDARVRRDRPHGAPARGRRAPGRALPDPVRRPGATGLGKPLKLMLRPLRADIPIYLAAIGPKNVALAAEIADGWLPIFVDPERFDDAFGPSLAGAPEGFEIAATVNVLVGDDVQALRDSLKPYLALYVGGMGAKGKNFYNSLMRRYGWEAEAERIQELYLGGNQREAIAAVPGRARRRGRARRPEGADPRPARGLARDAGDDARSSARRSPRRSRCSPSSCSSPRTFARKLTNPPVGVGNRGRRDASKGGTRDTFTLSGQVPRSRTPRFWRLQRVRAAAAAVTRKSMREKAMRAGTRVTSDHRSNALWGRGGRRAGAVLTTVGCVLIVAAGSSAGNGNNGGNNVQTALVKTMSSHLHAYIPAALLSAAQQNPKQSFDVILQGQKRERAGNFLKKAFQDSQQNGQNVDTKQIKRQFLAIDGARASLTGWQILALGMSKNVTAIMPNDTVKTTSVDLPVSNTEKWGWSTGAAVDWTGQALSLQTPTIAIVDSGIDASRAADFGNRVIGRRASRASCRTRPATDTGTAPSWPASPQARRPGTPVSRRMRTCSRST